LQQCQLQTASNGLQHSSDPNNEQKLQTTSTSRASFSRRISSSFASLACFDDSKRSATACCGAGIAVTCRDSVAAELWMTSDRLRSSRAEAVADEFEGHVESKYSSLPARVAAMGPPDSIADSNDRISNSVSGETRDGMDYHNIAIFLHEDTPSNDCSKASARSKDRKTEGLGIFGSQWDQLGRGHVALAGQNSLEVVLGCVVRRWCRHVYTRTVGIHGVFSRLPCIEPSKCRDCVCCVCGLQGSPLSR
jgi:hypothetical protein